MVDFTVLQYNTLASSYVSNFPKCKNEFLFWEYRRQKLLETIGKPDIISLQAVDRYGFFENIYSENGNYFGFFEARESNIADGSALFVNQNKFEVMWVSPIMYHGSTQVALIAELIVKENGKHLIFATTHLKAKKEFEEKRLKEAEQLCEEIRNYNNQNYPVIITGDMNSDPGGPVYKLFCSQYQSAYAESEIEPEFTTFKIRDEDKLYCHTIDYIFYDGDLTVVEKEKLPTKDEIGVNGMPNEKYPSDHLPLRVTMRI